MPESAPLPRQARPRVPNGYMRNPGCRSFSRPGASRAGDQVRRGRFRRSRRVGSQGGLRWQRSSGRRCAPSERARGRPPAVGAKLCVDGDELGAAVNNLNPLKLRLQPEHPSVAPASTDPAVPQLSSRVERDECGPARDEQGIAFCEPRPGNEIRAEDVRVDDDRSARPDRAHDSTAARKAAPSSSLRSSITISSCGGRGRARRRSSSTGSSRCSSRLSGACVDTPQI